MPPRNTQDDDRVMALVEMALATPRERRRSFLEQTCAGDSHLFEQAWNCVEWEERMAGFLGEPVVAREKGPEHPLEMGELLMGRFRIVREIAQGGMGVVYQAYDEKLDRVIALKCAKQGYGIRLTPEVRNASEISHPNVCKIYEIHTAQTSHGEMDFLTMEYLEGETLAQRLAGPAMTADERREIALQICAGLKEAHHRQVIHGDLKCGNVIVTSDEGGGRRAVITDFGLARRPTHSQGTTSTGLRGGTPQYMAPELFTGGVASAASDIYALGVMLKELAPEDSVLQKLATRATAASPEDRPASVEAIRRELEPVSRRRWLMIVAAAAMAAISYATAHYVAAGPRESIRLAVLPLEGPVPPAIQTEAITKITALAGAPAKRYAVVQGRDRATHTLEARLEPQEKGYVLAARISAERAGGRVREWQARYEEGETGYVPAALAGMVSGTFHLAAAPAVVTERARPDYLAGLEALHKDSSVDVAVILMERAASNDPDSPLTLAGLAEAYRWKGRLANDSRSAALAREAARKAEIRNPDLAEVHRIVGALNADSGRYEEAIDEYLRSIELQPAESEGHRRIAAAYAAANQPDKSLAELRRAADLGPHRYRNFQSLAAFYYERGDYPHSIEYLRRAAEVAPAEAAPRLMLANSYKDTGQYADAETELRTALAFGETPLALHLLGMVLTCQGRDAEALPYFERAVTSMPVESFYWINLASAYRRLNRTAMAQRTYRKALALTEKEVQDDPRDNIARSYLAYVCARVGDRRRAESEIAQALRLGRSKANLLWMAAYTYEALGQRDEALKILSESPRSVVEDAARFPDLAELQRDIRFKELLARTNK